MYKCVILMCNTYIYIYRERERERCMYIYIYIYTVPAARRAQGRQATSAVDISSNDNSDI